MKIHFRKSVLFFVGAAGFAVTALGQDISQFYKCPDGTHVFLEPTEPSKKCSNAGLEQNATWILLLKEAEIHEKETVAWVANYKKEYEKKYDAEDDKLVPKTKDPAATLAWIDFRKSLTDGHAIFEEHAAEFTMEQERHAHQVVIDSSQSNKLQKILMSGEEDFRMSEERYQRLSVIGQVKSARMIELENSRKAPLKALREACVVFYRSINNKKIVDLMLNEVGRIKTCLDNDALPPGP